MFLCFFHALFNCLSLQSSTVFFSSFSLQVSLFKSFSSIRTLFLSFFPQRYNPLLQFSILTLQSILLSLTSPDAQTAHHVHPTRPHHRHTRPLPHPPRPPTHLLHPPPQSQHRQFLLLQHPRLRPLPRCRLSPSLSLSSLPLTPQSLLSLLTTLYTLISPRLRAAKFHSPWLILVLETLLLLLWLVSLVLVARHVAYVSYGLTAGAYYTTNNTGSATAADNSYLQYYNVIYANLRISQRIAGAITGFVAVQLCVLPRRRSGEIERC